MPRAAILQEVRNLHRVGDRPDLIAQLNPLVSEALVTASVRIRSTATLLEVLVATTMGPLSE